MNNHAVYFILLKSDKHLEVSISVFVDNYSIKHFSEWVIEQIEEVTLKIPGHTFGVANLKLIK